MITGVVMRTAYFALLGTMLISAVLPVSAHHSFATQYDGDAPVTLTGIVADVEWLNPHARFYIDVADQAGNVTRWNLELASPNVLRRNGWTRNALKAGDEVTVEGSLARDGSNMANAQSVVLADGRQVFARNPTGN